MAREMRAPVLLLGGTGIVGSRTLKGLRQLYPDLPVAVAGRDQGKAQTLATEVGNVDIVQVDIGRPDLGLHPSASYSAIVALLKENTLNPLRYAQANGLPYISMADYAFEISPTVAFHLCRSMKCPVLLASHWMAGMTTLPTLQFAREFSVVHSIDIVVIIDPADISGPMTREDVKQGIQNSPRPLVLDNGVWRWAGEDLATRRVKGLTDVDVHAVSILDVPSLAAATDARSVWFGCGISQSAGVRRGGPVTHDIIIEIEGDKKDEERGYLRVVIEAAQGVAGLTALGVVLGVERLLGLAGGPPVMPGLYVPELIIEPAHAVARLKEFGGIIRRCERPPSMT